MDITKVVGINESEGFRMVLLLMIWAQLLFGGMMVGTPDSTRTRRMPVWSRMTSSGILVFAAASWWYFALDTPLESYAAYITLGMSLGFVGDLLMAGVIKIPQIDAVLSGMVAFGLGHIAYIFGLLDLAREAGLEDHAIIQASLVIWWIIAFVLWLVLIVLPAKEKRGVLHYAALPYALLLASTTALACALALQDGGLVFVAIGAILFLLSDLLLAMHLFNDTYFPLIDDVVWLLYGPAQMLIVYGVVIFGLGISQRLLGL